MTGPALLSVHEPPGSERLLMQQLIACPQPGRLDMFDATDEIFREWLLMGFEIRDPEGTGRICRGKIGSKTVYITTIVHFLQELDPAYPSFTASFAAGPFAKHVFGGNWCVVRIASDFDNLHIEYPIRAPGGPGSVSVGVVICRRQSHYSSAPQFDCTAILDQNRHTI